MNHFLRMVNTQSILFLYMLVGWFCRKTDLFDDTTRSKLTDFMLQIALPCMVFESFRMDFDLDALKRGAAALLVALVMALLALLLGKILYYPFAPREKSILQYGTLVTNSGFAGLPIISETYGNEGLFFASLFIIPTRILMWSAGISLFSHENSLKDRLKKILLNPAIIAVELGLLRLFLQFPLPGFLESAIDNFGQCTSPMAMALVGAILADVEVKNFFEPKAFYLVLVRQIILPFLCLGIMKLLAFDELLTGVSVVLSGMPIGATTAMLAQKYGADAQFASKCIFISTLTSLITVPILTLFI